MSDSCVGFKILMSTYKQPLLLVQKSALLPYTEKERKKEWKGYKFNASFFIKIMWFCSNFLHFKFFIRVIEFVIWVQISRV